MIPIVVSIGTTHPWNIAGLGLDAQVAREFGARSVAVIVGVTAQDERGLHAKFALPAEIVRAQLAALPRQQIGSLRIGALFDEANVREIASFLQTHRDVPAVVDPVFEATLGGMFGDNASFIAFHACMFETPIILTPNLSEASRLLNRPIETVDEMIAAAHALQRIGARDVLIKGGHLAGDPIDVLVTGDETKVFKDARLPGSMRGTGCTLAAALACELARGLPIVPAVESARAFVRAKIAAQNTVGPLQVAF
ncbi:MAG: PfkB family carbohydrate kinase [Candidatus Baltobacteraceae bacterium]